MNKEDLRGDLAALGVEAGSLVMVHASLRSIGLGRTAFGPGGAETLLDALDEAIGPDGTSIMLLGTDYAMDWIYAHPPEARPGLLAGSPAFDHHNAPAMPEAGWLAEAFRRRAGTIVSDNPSGRFGARGARAAEMMADQPWHDYYGPGSPLEKLCDWGGRVLRLGANPDTVTALHYAEYLADVSDKWAIRWDYVVAGPDGAPEYRWIDCLDDSNGIARWDGDDYFTVILQAYLTLERHRESTVGAARGEMIDAADLVAFGARWMEENLANI